jgi:hypothetical protein
VTTTPRTRATVPTTPEPWLELEAAKDHLNLGSSSTNDEELGRFLRRTERALTRRCGHVALSDPITKQFHGNERRTTLRADITALPVGVVITVRAGGGVVPAADVETGTAGWYFEDDTDQRVGIFRHSRGTFGSGPASVQYRAGHEQVPEDLELASLELLRHLWKTQRGSLVTRPGMRGEKADGISEEDATPKGFTWPKRVLELAEPFFLPRVS